MAKKTKFLAKGRVEKTDIVFSEYVWAFSVAQAIKIVVFRLKKKHPSLPIFLADVKISCV